MSIYKCSVCETVFDETNEGKKWDQLPGDWTCHVCESGKSFWRIADDTSASDASGGRVEVAADAESVPEKMFDGYNHPGSCTQETVGDR